MVTVTVSPFDVDRSGDVQSILIAGFEAQSCSKVDASMLLAEMEHRLKNLVAAVAGIAELCADADRRLPVDDFVTRLRALADAHGALLEPGPSGNTVEKVVNDQLSPVRGTSRGRVSIEGEPVPLSREACLVLSMVVHELATNALKHGALASTEGSVALSWRITRAPSTGTPHFAMSWRETGAAAPTARQRSGFGAFILGEFCERAFGAVARSTCAADGFSWELDAPASRLLGSSIADDDAVRRPTPRAADHADLRPRVLVVEDDPLQAEVCAMALAEAGFAVVGPAGSVTAALDAIAVEGCDAAVLDARLAPDETSEAVAAVLLAKGVPFVVLSASLRGRDVGALSRGAQLDKPATPSMLQDVLERLIARGADGA